MVTRPGKHTKSYGKSPSFIGTSTINGLFSRARQNYQCLKYGSLVQFLDEASWWLLYEDVTRPLRSSLCPKHRNLMWVWKLWGKNDKYSIGNILLMEKKMNGIIWWKFNSHDVLHSDYHYPVGFFWFHIPSSDPSRCEVAIYGQVGPVIIVLQWLRNLYYTLVN